MTSNNQREKNLVIVRDDAKGDAPIMGYVLQDVFEANRDALITVCALALTTQDACVQDDESDNTDHVEAAARAFSWLYAALRDMCDIPEDGIRSAIYQRMVDMGTAVVGEL